MFKFSYTKPTLDWYEDVEVTIKKEDYNYFRLERRHDRRWWIIGLKFNNKDYTWNEKQIGPINNNRVKDFINWCNEEYGNRIIEFKAINGNLNLISKIIELVHMIEKP